MALHIYPCASSSDGSVRCCAAPYLCEKNDDRIDTSFLPTSLYGCQEDGYCPNKQARRHNNITSTPSCASHSRILCGSDMSLGSCALAMHLSTRR